jgi:hypothetical protein
MKQNFNLKTLLLAITVIFTTILTNAQNNLGVGTATPNASAKLDVTSTTQGMLVPRMDSTQRVAIASPAQGLLVYQTNGTQGFWYYKGAAWVNLGASGDAFFKVSTADTNNIVYSDVSKFGKNFLVNTDIIDEVTNTQKAKLMLIDSKKAFRAGGNSGGNWNMANIGTYSIGLGYSTKASGLATVALGNATTAIGQSSMATGENTTAFGNYSTAMGEATLASGLTSTAMGYGTKAIGHYSAAMGYQAIANGYRSAAIGSGTITKSLSETVVGQFNDTLINALPHIWMGDVLNRVFTVGTGQNAQNRNSAFTVLQNGSVRIGNNGSYYKHIFSDKAILGPSTSQKQTFTITTGKSFAGTGQLITATVENQPGQTYQDVFNVTIAEITATSFKAVIYRLDGTSWGQTPVLHYTITAL